MPLDKGLLSSKLNLTISVQLAALVVECVGNLVTDRLADGAVRRSSGTSACHPKQAQTYASLKRSLFVW